MNLAAVFFGGNRDLFDVSIVAEQVIDALQPVWNLFHFEVFYSDHTSLLERAARLNGSA